MPPGVSAAGADAPWACCSLGNKCVKLNQHYWQCKQDAGATLEGFVSDQGQQSVGSAAEALKAKMFGDVTVSDMMSRGAGCWLDAH